MKHIPLSNKLNHNKVISELHLNDLYHKYKDHHRMKVFAQKGLKCVNPACSRVGARLILTQQKGGSMHIDIYTADLHLMTVDHIIPKSKGGGEEMENKQPMCAKCNSSKSDKIINYETNICNTTY